MKEKEPEGRETDVMHTEDHAREEGRHEDRLGEGGLEVNQGKGTTGKSDWAGGRSQAKGNTMRYL